MLYRETGQYKTSYAADQALFPLDARPCRFRGDPVSRRSPIPLFGSDFFLNTIMIPFLVFSLAAIGLNLLTGYAGQISLGTGGFMGVGAYACYKLTTPVSRREHPGPDPGVGPVLGGDRRRCSGCRRLRIKGFYLAVATLAAQFFLDWCFNRIAWLYNYNASGAIEVPTRTVLGVAVTGPTATPMARYYALLALVALLAWVASNLVRGRIGRSWMMVRDMDIAAELMGVRLLRTKLLAFAVSSFYCGVAGALMVFLWLGAAEASSFAINVSFQVLFMVIIGGARQPARLVPGRRIHLDPADPDPNRSRRPGHPRRRRDRRASELHDRGRSDHRDPDRRAARLGPHLADRQAADAHLAVPLLTATACHHSLLAEGRREAAMT